MPLGSDFSTLDFGTDDFDPVDFSPADFRTLRSFQVGPPTGPPYPPPPQFPVQPGIGTFVIGASPIGDIIPFSFWNTIISQYANSPILTTLIGNFQQYIDQTKNMDALFDNIWNIATARDYGLDVWGRIVGVVRVVQIQTGKFFGFEEQTPATVEDFGPGGVGPFYNGVAATSNFALADKTFRQLILAKAMANISDGSVPSINAILRALFPNRGNVYVADGRNMTMQIVFTFPITKAELAIVSTSGVLPKPSGVANTIVYPSLM
jgi:hypothetical protein